MHGLLENLQRLGPEKKRDYRGCKSSKLVDKAVWGEGCAGGGWGAAQLTL